MKVESHSIKALKTIEAMGTIPEQWTLVPIKYVLEDREYPVKVRCPDCVHGEAWLTPKGAAHNFFKHCKGGLSGFEEQEQIAKYSLTKGRCPTCPKRPGYSSRGTGEIWKLKIMKVWVGYPQWLPNTRFDSRFHDALYYTERRAQKTVWYCCELCSKSILDPYSGLVPVHATDDKGMAHGMWVGADCGRKFLKAQVTKPEKSKRGDKFLIINPLLKA